MGQVVHPRLYIHFADEEIQVITPFGNIITSFPYGDDFENLKKANRFIEEWEAEHGQPARRDAVNEL